MSFKINDTDVIDNSRNVPSTVPSVTGLTNFTVPNGTTAQRPVGSTGKLFYDSQIGQLLVHDGVNWNAAHELNTGDNLFDIRSYTGTANTQTISTGDVDLATNGGLIIIKKYHHDSSGPNTWSNQSQEGAWWIDTERGVSSFLNSAVDNVEDDYASYWNNGFGVRSISTTGWELGGGSGGNNIGFNESGKAYMSYVFRKAPRFFDIQKGTTDSQGHITFNHDLGVTPGMVILKSRTDMASSGGDNWYVYHRGAGFSGIPADQVYQFIDTGDGYTTTSSGKFWTTVNSTTFTAEITGYDPGRDVVAYFFAHNDNDGVFGNSANEDFIKCGSYDGNGVADRVIDLGFEPGWLMVRKMGLQRTSGAMTWTNNDTTWRVVDFIRGFSHTGDHHVGLGDTTTQESDGLLRGPNNTGSEIAPMPNGFRLNGSNNFNQLPNNGNEFYKYIYVAIRRTPIAVPTDKNKIIHIGSHNAGVTSTRTNLMLTTGFPPDFNLSISYTTGTTIPRHWITDRVRGFHGDNTPKLATHPQTGTYPYQETIVGASASGSWYGDVMTGFYTPASQVMNSSYSTNVSVSLRRGTGFFDIVPYLGNKLGDAGNSTIGITVKHNLGVVPEMIWIKQRDADNLTRGVTQFVYQNWAVYHKDLTDSSHNYMILNHNYAEITTPTNPSMWDSADPTSTEFTLSNYNAGSAISSFVNQSDNSTSPTYHGQFIAYLFATLSGISKVGSFSHTNGSSTDVDCGFGSTARFVMVKSKGVGDWYVWDSVRGINAGADSYVTINTHADPITNTDWIDPLSTGFQMSSGFATGNYIFYALA
tara:strand:- start:1338 stop:3770 length:2433 start_codon:yes stop_codon:yes gene_type:complete